MHVNEERLYKLVGTRIRQMRTAAGVTQSQLAEATGLLRTSVTNVEVGRQKAPLHVLYRICAFLGIEVGAMLPEIGMVADPGDDIVTAPQQLQHTLPQTAAFLEKVLNESREDR